MSLGVRIDVSKIPENPFSANPPADTPDPFTANCIEDALLKTQNLLNKGLSDDLDARRVYARCAFGLVVAWVLGMFAMLFLQGFFGHEVKYFLTDGAGNDTQVVQSPVFLLSDNVLLAAIGGTTASIIGIFMVVMQNLFPSYPTKRTISSKDQT